MPSTLDSELSRGMEKLTRASWPVKAVKRPSALARACVERDAIKEAVNATNEGLLARLAVKVGLGAPTPSLDKQLVLAEEKVKALEEDVIEGVLTPLMEREKWAVHAQFVEIELYLRSQIPRQLGNTLEIKAANEAADKALDITGNLIFMEKWICYALKKKKNDGLEYYFPRNSNGEFLISEDIEKTVLQQLWAAYHNAFTPTEAELKKSAAPTTRKPS